MYEELHDDPHITDYLELPRQLSGHSIVDMCESTHSLIVEEPLENYTGTNKHRFNFDIHKIDASDLGSLINQKEASRVYLIFELQTNIHRVAYGAGSIVQAFTVFPREKLEVSTSSSIKNSEKIDDTHSILDSSESQSETDYSKEILDELRQSSTNVTSWQTEGNIGSNLWSLSTDLSGSHTEQTTVKAAHKRLLRQAKKASLARKVEVKTHREVMQEKTINYETTRTLYNPNYDKPMDFLIYESVAHLVISTEVTNIKLIYQSKSRSKEIQVDINEKEDLSNFVNQVCVDDSSESRKKLLEILEAKVTIETIDESGMGRVAYSPIGDELGYTPVKEINYYSTLKDEAIKIRSFGIVIDIDEAALPTGDVIGKVRKGFGDARGHVSEKIHSESTQQMELATKLAEVKVSTISTLLERVSKSSDEEGFKWAELLVKAMGNADVANDIDEYYE